MKKKVVLLKNVKHDFDIVVELDSNGELNSVYTDGSYVALSEEVTVEFKELSSKDVLDAQLKVIEGQIKNVSADAEAAITSLNRRKQELLALENI